MYTKMYSHSTYLLLPIESIVKVITNQPTKTNHIVHNSSFFVTSRHVTSQLIVILLLAVTWNNPEQLFIVNEQEPPYRNTLLFITID